MAALWTLDGSASCLPAPTVSPRGEMGGEWVIFPRRGGVSPADDEAMETNDIPPQGGPRDGGTAGNQAGQRTLRRPAQDRVFAGVGAGVADYLGTDVTATRVGLAAVAVLAHVAIPVYVAGWALIPEEGKSRSRAAEFLDSVTTRVRQA
jgi:phage shock protein PspC (stress-responsive transcriptional regulator)